MHTLQKKQGTIDTSFFVSIEHVILILSQISLSFFYLKDSNHRVFSNYFGKIRHQKGKLIECSLSRTSLHPNIGDKKRNPLRMHQLF